MSNLGHQLESGENEPQMSPELGRHLKPGAVFIDLGANECYFSVIASRLVGRGGAVIAVEPQSRLQSVIQANLTLNRCHNVRLMSAVISSKTEKVRLQLTPGANTGGSSLFRQTKYPLRTEEVQSFSLADFMERTGIACVSRPLMNYRICSDNTCSRIKICYSTRARAFSRLSAGAGFRRSSRPLDFQSFSILPAFQPVAV